MMTRDILTKLKKEELIEYWERLYSLYWKEKDLNDTYKCLVGTLHKAMDYEQDLSFSKRILEEESTCFIKYEKELFEKYCDEETESEEEKCSYYTKMH